jgi:exonuclease III
MRLMTWNCRVGAFRKKAARTAPLNPDVLVIPEVERLEGELFLDGDRQPTFRDRVAKPGWPRGTGVFSYTGVELRRAFDEADVVHGFAPYSARKEDFAFQVVAVWTFDTKVAATTYRQAHEGLRRHEQWIRQAPTVVLGDFNITARYKSGAAWRDLVDLLAPLDLTSAYHHVHRETPGQETHPTYFHKGREDDPWHIDFCFIPTAWVQRVTKVEVGRHAEWRDVSDHVPLIVDIDL